MTCRTNPANSPTNPGHAGPPDSLKNRTGRFSSTNDPSPCSSTALFNFSLLHFFIASPSSYSLFPVPYSLLHRDSNHGEHKFPHLRGVPPSFQSTSSFFYLCAKVCFGAVLVHSSTLRSALATEKTFYIRCCAGPTRRFFTDRESPGADRPAWPSAPANPSLPTPPRRE